MYIKKKAEYMGFLTVCGFNHLFIKTIKYNLNTAVMSFLCPSSLKFFCGQSDIGEFYQYHTVTIGTKDE